MRTYPPSIASNALLPVLMVKMLRRFSRNSNAVMKPKTPGMHFCAASLIFSIFNSLKPLISSILRREHIETICSFIKKSERQQSRQYGMAYQKVRVNKRRQCSIWLLSVWQCLLHQYLSLTSQPCFPNVGNYTYHDSGAFRPP